MQDTEKKSPKVKLETKFNIYILQDLKFNSKILLLMLFLFLFISMIVSSHDASKNITLLESTVSNLHSHVYEHYHDRYSKHDFIKNTWILSHPY